MTYLEVVGTVQEDLTLGQLEDLEAIVSAEVRVQRRVRREELATDRQTQKDLAAAAKATMSNKQAKRLACVIRWMIAATAEIESSKHSIEEGMEIIAEKTGAHVTVDDIAKYFCGVHPFAITPTMAKQFFDFMETAPPQLEIAS